MATGELSNRASLAVLGAWGCLMKLAYWKQRRKEAREAEETGTPTSEHDRSKVDATPLPA